MRIKAFIISLLYSSFILASDLIVEPYLGYQLGEYRTGENTDSKHGAGIGIGTKLAYFNSGFFVGLDFHHSKIKVKDYHDQKLGQYQIGPMVGFAFPVIPVRVWLSYNASDSLKYGGASYDGSGVKLGMGFDPLPLVSFDIEYKSSSYDENGDIPLNEKRKYSSIFFSVGLLLGINI